MLLKPTVDSLAQRCQQTTMNDRKKKRFWVGREK